MHSKNIPVPMEITPHKLLPTPSPSSARRSSISMQSPHKHTEHSQKLLARRVSSDIELSIITNTPCKKQPHLRRQSLPLPIRSPLPKNMFRVLKVLEEEASIQRSEAQSEALVNSSMNVTLTSPRPLTNSELRDPTVYMSASSRLNPDNASRLREEMTSTTPTTPRHKRRPSTELDRPMSKRRETRRSGAGGDVVMVCEINQDAGVSKERERLRSVGHWWSWRYFLEDDVALNRTWWHTIYLLY
jgi:hypothetical protein